MHLRCANLFGSPTQASLFQSASGNRLLNWPLASLSACFFPGNKSGQFTGLWTVESAWGCIVDNLLFLKTYRTTGLPVRNNPLTNIPKGFSSEMTLEVAEGRLQVTGLCMLKTHGFAWLNAFLQKNWYNLNKSIYCFHCFSCYFTGPSYSNESYDSVSRKPLNGFQNALHNKHIFIFCEVHIKISSR